MVDDIPVPLPAKPVKLVDRFRYFMRSLNMSYRTEQAYVHWLLRYIRFHNRKHPDSMGVAELEAFLSHLAVNLNSAINTQRTALNALIFFYNNFLDKKIEGLAPVRATKHRRVPVVFSHDEAARIIQFLEQPYKLAAQLMYGAGLRVNECLRLRVKDVDFTGNQLIVRAGKGGKDRRTILPKSLIDNLRQQIAIVQKLHDFDTAEGFGEVYMPNHLAAGYDIRTLQELLGHSDVKTTEIYTHVLNKGGLGVRSPLDNL